MTIINKALYFLIFVVAITSIPAQGKKTLEQVRPVKAGNAPLEVVEARLDSTIIPFGKTFDASEDWLFRTEFLVKNVSTYKIKNAVIAIDFWNGNPFLQYVASFNSDSQCNLLKTSDFTLAPGETIVMKGRFPTDGADKWKDRVDELKVDLSQMRLYWAGILLDDGRTWVSGHFLPGKK